MKKHIRLTLDVSLELNRVLQLTALRLGITKAEVLRRSVTLMELAVDGKARGERIVLVDADGRITTRIAL
jgi:hypothetical protein